MAAVAPSGARARDRQASRWTRRSLQMLPVFLGVFVVTSLVSEYLVLPWLGLSEGDLMLMERGVAGWSCEIGFALVLVAPAVAGVGSAVAALRSTSRPAAWVGLVLNAILVGFVAYLLADAVHMTYDPQGTWLGS